MSIFKKTVEDASKEAGTVIGNVMSSNVQNGTDAAVEGMSFFRQKAFDTRNAGFDQSKGNLFEYIEAAKFNRSAANAGKSARAIVTDITDPHAEADILIKDNGKIAKEIQAKFIKTSKDGRDISAATSVRDQTGANNKGWGQYDGMDRLIRKQENYNSEGSLLDEAKKLSKARADSNGIYSEYYRDVNEHLTDETQYDGVSSGGTTYEEVQFCFKKVWTIPLFCAIFFHEVIESFLEDAFGVKLFYQISITFSIPFSIFSLTSIVTLQLYSYIYNGAD